MATTVVLWKLLPSHFAMQLVQRAVEALWPPVQASWTLRTQQQILVSQTRIQHPGALVMVAVAVEDSGQHPLWHSRAMVYKTTTPAASPVTTNITTPRTATSSTPWRAPSVHALYHMQVPAVSKLAVCELVICFCCAYREHP
jgi:hypothetical protein